MGRNYSSIFFHFFLSYTLCIRIAYQNCVGIEVFSSIHPYFSQFLKWFTYIGLAACTPVRTPPAAPAEAQQAESEAYSSSAASSLPEVPPDVIPPPTNPHTDCQWCKSTRHTTPEKIPAFEQLHQGCFHPKTPPSPLQWPPQAPINANPTSESESKSKKRLVNTCYAFF